MKIPQIKKKISSYLLGEEGKISKQTLLTIGAFLGGAALSGVLLAEPVESASQLYVIHANTLSLAYAGTSATATHTHHANWQHSSGA